MMVIGDCMKRKVFSISKDATIRQAAQILMERHIGTLPVLDGHGRPIGILKLSDLLSLELPDFFKLLPDFDFAPDFGAVETTRPAPHELDRPVTTLLHPPVISAVETCGLLRAYALMLKHRLQDLMVVSEDGGALVGIASRVDIGVAVLSSWQTVGPV